MFLHGYLSDGKAFSKQVSYFKRNFAVFAPDLCGFGTNLEMPYAYSLDDYCEQVSKYIFDNGLTRPCVIAHSFGGRIALKLAATQPKLFDKIVLTGCAGLKPRRTFKYRLKKLIFKILKRFTDRKKLLRFYASDYRALSPVMKESFKKITAEYLDGYLDKIKTPTFIVFGKNDRETPLYLAKRLNKGIKDSRLCVLKNAGHFCFVEKSGEFNRVVNDFLWEKQR